MPAKIVELEAIGTVQLYKRRGSRSIRLSFDSKGQVRVSLPTWAPYQAAIKFTQERAGWIEKHRPAVKSAYRNGERIGKAHRLVFIADTKVKTAQVHLVGTEIIVKYPLVLAAKNNKVQAAAERGAKKALQEEADSLLPQRLQTLAAAHSFNFRSVTVKQLKSKWGSCNQNHEITLNYYLMQLPWELIDYVLIHELVHTEYLNHSEAFWKRFEAILPGAKKIRKQLKMYKTTVVQSA